MLVGQEDEQHIHRCTWKDVGPVPDEPFVHFVMNKIAQYGDKVALIDGVSGETLKYSELIALVQKLNVGWQAVGLKTGEVVCLVAPNCLLTLPVILAAAAVAAPVTLANPLCTPDELQRHISDSQSKWVIVHPACLKSVQAATKDIQNLKGIYVLGEDTENGLKPLSSLQQEEVPRDWVPGGVSGDDVVFLPYSSGTTGLPKGVKLSSTNYMAVLSTTGRPEYLSISNKDIILGILPFFHVFGIGLCLASITEGATMVTLPRFIPNIFLNAVQVNKVTILPVVPPLVLFLAKHELVSQFDLSSVKHVVSGAAPLSGDMQQLLTARLPQLTVRQGFGMTETTLACFTSETCDMGAVGHVTPHCQAKIIDMETGNSLGPNKDGELCVKGPVITKGYVNNSESTSELIDAGGWLHTGDIGRYDDSGCFYIVDRIKELVKYKGHQVAPAELEGLLVTHEAVTQAAVVGVLDKEAGELPKAYIVLKPNHTIVPQELVAWVQERVAPHKRLRAGVEIIDAIPCSPSGKILRRKLREKANNL